MSRRDSLKNIKNLTDPKLLNSIVYFNTKFIFNFLLIRESYQRSQNITGPKNKYEAAQRFPTLIINQHIRMISEGSCDTEDWSNDAENSALHHRNKLYFKVY